MLSFSQMDDELLFVHQWTKLDWPVTRQSESRTSCPENRNQNKNKDYIPAFFLLLVYNEYNKEEDNNDDDNDNDDDGNNDDNKDFEWIAKVRKRIN